MLKNLRSKRQIMIALLALASPWYSTHTIEFDTGNPDLAVHWDSTVRYDLGARAQKWDERIVNTALEASLRSFSGSTDIPAA